MFYRVCFALKITWYLVKYQHLSHREAANCQASLCMCSETICYRSFRLQGTVPKQLTGLAVVE